VSDATIRPPHEVESSVTRRKPRILIDPVNPEITVDALCGVFSQSGKFFDRGVPVRLSRDSQTGMTIAEPLSSDAIILAAHRMARPFKFAGEGDNAAERDARLPASIANYYLSDRTIGTFRHLME
jgi:hypothetical protein